MLRQLLYVHTLHTLTQGQHVHVPTQGQHILTQGQYQLTQGQYIPHTMKHYM